MGSQLLTNCEVITKVIELGLMVIMGHSNVEFSNLKSSTYCLIMSFAPLSNVHPRTMKSH